MDDFYTSMADAGALEPLNKNVELQQNNINTDSSSLLFVDALVPLNPARWASFTAGSAAGSDMPDISGKLGTPFANLQVAQEYLATSQSDVQYRDRIWKVAEDTITINASCELGGDIGSFSAGAMSNKIADNYMNEMVETEVTKNLNEKLNMEIFRATAKDNQRELETVRGTGTIRQNVPEHLQADLCDRPKRNTRPPEWGNTGGLEEPGLGSGPLKPNNSPDGRPSSDSIGPSGGLGSEPSISSDVSVNLDDDTNNGIFAKCFGWLGFGAGEGSDQCFDQGAAMDPYEIERLREEKENDYKSCSGWDWFLGSGSGMAPPPIDHPSMNPPMFLGETFLPPDQ